MDVVDLSILEVLVRVCVRRDGTNCSMKVMGSSPWLPQGCCKSGCSSSCFYSFLLLMQLPAILFQSPLQFTTKCISPCRWKCSSSHPSQSEFSVLNACIFSAQKSKSHVLKKINPFKQEMVSLYWPLHVFALFAYFIHLESQLGSNTPAYSHWENQRNKECEQ